MARAIVGGELRATPKPRFAAGWAREEDNSALRRLLRETPMEGRIRIALEREPDFFRAPKLEGDRHHTAVARDPATNELFAMCSRSVRERYVNGAVNRVGYLSQLRIHPAHRGQTRPLLKAGFQWLMGTRHPDETPFDITSIMDDNLSARRLLTAGLPGLPVYTELEQILTLLIRVRHRRARKAPAVVRATPAAKHDIIDCLHRFNRRHQFAPHWTMGNMFSADTPGVEDFFLFVEAGRVTGCVALWDQRDWKQTVVRSYSGALARSRWILNLLGAGLPPAGSVVPMAWLSHLAVDEDRPEVFESLVQSVLAHVRPGPDLEWLTLGLAARHPLSSTARRFAAHTHASRLYAVHQPGTNIRLDSRIPHVEVALL